MTYSSKIIPQPQPSRVIKLSSQQTNNCNTTAFSENFPKKSNFWSLVSKYDNIDGSKNNAHPSIFDIFKDSIDATQFLNRLITFPGASSSREAIERLTRGQSANRIWFEYRKMTITGSKAHLLNNVEKFNRGLNPNARDMLIGGNRRELNFPPIIYGRNNEAVARCQFIARKTMELPGFVFQERGMYLDKTHPFIAASVDGLYSFDVHDSINDDDDHHSVFSPGFSDENENDDLTFSLMSNMDHPGRVTRLLEIKCPYILRDTGLKKGVHKLKYLVRLAGAAGNDDVPLKDLYRLKKSSVYYTQIQLYLRVYNLKVCTLLIWTPYDFLELDIEQDCNFGETLFSNLTRLYRDEFIPTLIFEKNR